MKGILFISIICLSFPCFSQKQKDSIAYSYENSPFGGCQEVIRYYRKNGSLKKMITDDWNGNRRETHYNKKGKVLFSSRKKGWPRNSVLPCHLFEIKEKYLIEIKESKNN